MPGETQDNTIGIFILDAFGFKTKLPVYEVAPCTIRYLTTPEILTNNMYRAALADNIGRMRVVVDTLPSDWDPTGIFQVDIAKVLGDVLSKTNPVHVRLSNGTINLDPRDRNWELAGDTDVVDILDKATRILGKIYGDQGILTQYASDKSLLTREQNPITGFATSALQASIIAYIDGIETLLAGGLPAALDTGALKVREQNWPAILSIPSTIGTLADVTAAASATQLTANSTPCKAVTVRSLAANTGVIRVGNSDVSATRGHELSAKDSVDISIDNVNKVYIFGNGTDKVSVFYVS